jgi:hypothetical protein
MATEAWIPFWKYLLYGSIGLYFVIALAVTVGAAFDVRKLLQLLARQSSPEHKQPPTVPD